MKTPLTIRLLWMFYISTLFFTLYGSVNQYTSMSLSHSSIIFEWEKNIPFIEEWIVPYTLIYSFFMITFLLPQSDIALRVLALRTATIVLFSVTVFLFFPLEFGSEKPPIEHFTWFTTALEWLDYPYNQAPSLHVSFSVILFFSLANRLKTWYPKAFLAFSFLTIVLSTLFVYQHHFIDVLTGLLLGFFTVYFLKEEKIKRESSIKNLKRANYAILGALLMIVGFFHLSWLFVFPFFGLVFFSLVFAFSRSPI